MALQTVEEMSESSVEACKVIHSSACASGILRLYKTETESGKQVYKKCHSIAINLYDTMYGKIPFLALDTAGMSQSQNRPWAEKLILF